MKLIVILFWSLLVGQVVGYIMTALAGVPDPDLWTTGISLVFGVFIWIIGAIAIDKPKKEA
ncbi:MAG: YjzD family protein [Streptococcaceae bacterium]|jgi:hypothetical protein|nr:YjzD family protein [Streptococcaceae bacterium]